MSGKGHETVLVVDDDPAVRTLACRVLEVSGYRVLTAKDGAEAIELAGCYGHAIDLLFTDLHMPRVAGDELAARLLRRRPGMRVLYASGDSFEPPRLAFDADRAAAFLAKPYTPDQLLSSIRQVLEATA